MRKTVYLSLGSNLGDRTKNLQAALERLRKLGDIAAVSSVYETVPVGLLAQPAFLNCALALETDLMPKQFLAQTRRIEEQLGRRRSSLVAGYRTASPESQPRKGPRRIDIDILLFGRTVMDTPSLTIPHPAMHERRFVLEPLAEIAAEIRHPVFRVSVRQLRDNAAKQKQTVRKASVSLA
jgi:2-amino-4-hydroxy-6-hydroxymethyldihydropteridine diphosphokinase